MSMKRRTHAVISSQVAHALRPLAGCGGGVGVVPAVIIACVLAVVLIGGLAAAGLARDGSGGVRIPFFDRGGSEADDDTSRANDEPDENEASLDSAGAGGENEPAESRREQERGSAANNDTSGANDEPDENESSAENARAGEENEPAESEGEREPDENERGEG